MTLPYPGLTVAAGRSSWCPVGGLSRALVVLAALWLSGTAVAQDGGHSNTREAGPAPAPGWSEELSFRLAEPGSYRLPVLGRAGDGRVLDSATGHGTSLHELFEDRFVILSFIYSSCSDANGCPLATFVLAKAHKKLRETDEAKDVRFISLSFDPDHDSPEVMAEYGRRFASESADWRFLTAADQSHLVPILHDYGQAITPEIGASGEATGNIAHLLRVYLIDREKRIRNIYSTSYLHPEVLLNDLRTLRMPEAQKPGDVASTTAAASVSLGAGDVKQGYENKNYQTRSRSLSGRSGRALELIDYLRETPLGLPPIQAPETNPVTAEKIKLGQRLFFDRRLSLNKTMACANCHIPEQGFTTQEMATALGIEGQTVRRNAPTLYNTAYLTRLFHDGRETSLERQVWGPLLASNEMGNPSPGYVLEQIRAIPEYHDRFRALFGERGLTMETLGQALATYQRVLVSGDSPFDRWYYGADKGAVNEEAKQGFKLFTGKAACSSCHTVGKDYALFTDSGMHNTGIGYARSMANTGSNRRIQVAPGTYIEAAPDVAAGASEAPPTDLGLYEITLDPEDRWKYRTPSLRNVALTAPYMHDGSVTSLERVVRFYNAGGIPNPQLDPIIRPLKLSEQEIKQLVAFLQTLTGSNIEDVVADALATPIGNVRALENQSSPPAFPDRRRR